MRALRVIGLDADGTSVVCEGIGETGKVQQYCLPADDKLRAAARGDLSRLGQIEIELDSQLRPRDIQARIRGGASVEQVAAVAGMPVQRVERFAHPVLLERSRAADLAREAHPVLPDGPAVATLDRVVTDAFRARGQDLDTAAWDAWRGEDGRWLVQLEWRAGRSTNTAHWRFQPGAHGGTVTALDDVAAELVHPDPTRPLRTVAPVAALTRPAVEVVEPDEVLDAAGPTTGAGSDPEARDEQAPEAAAPADPPPAPRAPTSHKARKNAKGHASLPSWEDVLLGVRSR